MPTCNVEGCDGEAVARLLAAEDRPTHRCRDCLLYDLNARTKFAPSTDDDREDTPTDLADTEWPSKSEPTVERTRRRQAIEAVPLVASVGIFLAVYGLISWVPPTVTWQKVVAVAAAIGIPASVSWALDRHFRARYDWYPLPARLGGRYGE